MKDAREEYGDIIDLEHFVAPDLPQMSRLNRAAQFSPFAALTGYEDLIDEAARQTREQIKPDESEKEEINRRLRILLQDESSYTAAITYFVPDGNKQGGSYKTVSGKLCKYDDYGRYIALNTGEVVFIDDIVSVDSSYFDKITI